MPILRITFAYLVKNVLCPVPRQNKYHGKFGRSWQNLSIIVSVTLKNLIINTSGKITYMHNITYITPPLEPT